MSHPKTARRLGIVRTPDPRICRRRLQNLARGNAAVSEPGKGCPLSWSPYVRLLSVERPEARSFYEAEAL
jgi:hypothetical protein